MNKDKKQSEFLRTNKQKLIVLPVVVVAMFICWVMLYKHYSSNVENQTSDFSSGSTYNYYLDLPIEDLLEIIVVPGYGRAGDLIMTNNYIALNRVLNRVNDFSIEV